MKQLNELKRVYKIPSKLLASNKWALQLPLDVALKDSPDLVVTIGNSQILRWIDELNGVNDYDSAVQDLKSQINDIKSKKETSKNKMKRKELIDKLNYLQFCPDYVNVVMNSKKDYDRCNKGFTINGILFRRLLGTNGGIKQSTIVYINERLYTDIKKRIDNGRNQEMKLVPAKLEAYQALVCSGSTPIPAPDGVIVVHDCITHFREDVITISNEDDSEPTLKYQNDYSIEHNNSDGYGLMTPEYSIKVNEYLTGDSDPISGMVIRNAFTKGSLFTFSFSEFGDSIGKYEITDVWGTKRDIRNADIILTESMLKLWDSYNSWEDYAANCKTNHYEWGVTKICPAALENVRSTNYQFLQSYQLNDDEIAELCRPTIEEIKDIISGDYRKSLIYLGGANLNADSFRALDDDYLKALILDNRMINDPYIKDQIHENLKKKMDRAKRGKIEISGNYAIIGGDPYALCESMFGLPVTGLLKAGEVYHRHWLDRGVNEIVCFRAPMTSHNNIRKMTVNDSDAVNRWFKYLRTVCILNAWDSTCEALNGADFDGDTFFTTNNPILLKNTRKERTIICQQRRAEKKIPTEADLIAANKIAFNDEIGAITNRITAMFEKQAQFDEDSEEYKVLQYRILCGQHYQQCQIDAAKGIISKPMPSSWYQLDDSMTEFERRICTTKKPYFMIYVYPEQFKDYNTYIKKSNLNSQFRFGKTISELQEIPEPSDDVAEYLKYYVFFMPVGNAACTVNKICYHVESELKDIPDTVKYDGDFDYTILKSNTPYSKQKYNEIGKIYKEYIRRVNEFMTLAKLTRISTEESRINKMMMISDFARQCVIACPDDNQLADILLDMLYTTNNKKSFVWALCGHTIIKNLMKDRTEITIPILDKNGNLKHGGNAYKMEAIKL